MSRVLETYYSSLVAAGRTVAPNIREAQRDLKRELLLEIEAAIGV